MNQEKPKGPGYEDIHFRVDDMAYRLTQDFKAGKPLDWPVLPAKLVSRVWNAFVTNGRVSEEAALERIFESIRDNTVRLVIANIVSGHDTITPDCLLDEHLLPDQHEAFCSWLIDYDEGWRISDYGIGPLTTAVALAFEAKTPAAQLKYLDRALHVTHQRSDLSKLFIEGGRNTVNGLPLETED